LEDGSVDHAQTTPPGCIEDQDRHGNLRVYYRPTKKSKKVRLHGTPWAPDFIAEYEAAKGNIAEVRKTDINPGTWRWLCVRYMTECTEYKRLDQRTQHVRKLILESTYDDR
jgi:hypothetical protein